MSFPWKFGREGRSETQLAPEPEDQEGIFGVQPSYIDEAGLELRDPTVSASWVMRLKGYTN